MVGSFVRLIFPTLRECQRDNKLAICTHTARQTPRQFGDRQTDPTLDGQRRKTLSSPARKCCGGNNSGNSRGLLGLLGPFLEPLRVSWGSLGPKVVRASVVHACQAPHLWGKVRALLGWTASGSEHGDDFILTVARLVLLWP
eukprot:9331506-Pyramimonas_sp.AAC.1